MADGKLDLPDDLLSSNPSDQSWTSKVETGGGNNDKGVIGLLDDLKVTSDQAATESSIPLSPQWLYVKPSETKPEMRGPSPLSLGIAADPNQKEGWRRAATDTESGRRWREEERETGLLGSRRERRKVDRRVESTAVRESTDNRALSTDRWHDVNSRNSGHDTRRDSKWSARWGPEDKDKESRTEKKLDAEKEDSVSESQSFSGSVPRAVPERDPDSRDKWRPRHRMDGSSGGSGSYRAAPGFGLERGKTEGSNTGFTLGRGRSSATIIRPPSADSIGAAQFERSRNVPGKPSASATMFCYPRAKILDIYRLQKMDPSFAATPNHIEDVPPITQVAVLEPLAFVTPDADEEGILAEMWKGKIISSGALYNSSRKGRASDSSTDVGDLDPSKQGVLHSILSDEIADASGEATGDGILLSDGVPHAKMADGDIIRGGDGKVRDATIDTSADDFMRTFPTRKAFYDGLDVDAQLAASQSQHEIAKLSLTENSSINNIATATSAHVDTNPPDNLNSLYVSPPSEPNWSDNLQHFQGKQNEYQLDGGLLEELSFFYQDPQGEIQGPFLGVDIISWFEQGFFGTDLPVRLEDAPAGTPFRELGEIMPHLKAMDGQPCGIDSTSAVEERGSLEDKSGHVLPEVIHTLNGHPHQIARLDGPGMQHVHSRSSGHAGSLQQSYTDGLSFSDFAAQEEEIVFPGRPGSGGDRLGNTSIINRDPPANNTNGNPSIPTFTESGMPEEINSKVHPFGLLWSELEGSYGRHNQAPNLPSVSSSQDLLVNSIGGGRVGPFGAVTDSAHAVETWPDVHKPNTVAGHNLYQDAIDARRLPHINQESNLYDASEKLLMQQYEQQLQQRNLLSHPNLIESLPEQVLNRSSSRRPHLANQTGQDFEHMLAVRQLQQQRQQQQQLQQQQQFHQQQMLLQEQQQSQAQQIILERLVQNQMHDSGRQSRFDAVRSNNTLDQYLLKQQLFNELQQRSHHAPRHPDQSLEHLIQSKFGQMPHQGQNDLLELVSRSKQGQMRSLEQQILQQEQLHARQLPLGLRQRMELEEERHARSVWPVGESGQFNRNPAAAAHPSLSAGFGQLDLFQQQQRPLPEEHFERNLSFQDRYQRGIYDPGLSPFERSLSLPGGAQGTNVDIRNALARGQGFDVPEPSPRVNTFGQVGGFSSGMNSSHPQIPNQFHASHEAIDGQWSESNGRPPREWIESQIRQLQLNADLQHHRESDVKMSSEDPNLWMSAETNNDNSKRLLMELLHQKSGHQSSDSLDVSNGVSYDRMTSSGRYSGAPSPSQSFNLSLEREAGMNNIFNHGAYGSSSGFPPQVPLAKEKAITLENSGRMPLRSNSGALSEGERLFSGISETSQPSYTDFNLINKSSKDRDFLSLELRQQGFKNDVGMYTKGSALEIKGGMVEQAGSAHIDRGELPANVITRNNSLSSAGGNTGYYSDKVGVSDSFNEEVPKDRVSALASKGPENILLKRSSLVPNRLSQEAMLSEMASDPVIRGKHPPTSVVSEGGRREQIAANQSSENLSSVKREMHFRRTSSSSDADVSEPLFVDMLKSNSKKSAAQAEALAAAAGGSSESLDGAQGGRTGGKKKTKKGKQIDPALLGFKVTSNRIMMGEIQRLDD